MDASGMGQVQPGTRSRFLELSTEMQCKIVEAAVFAEHGPLVPRTIVFDGRTLGVRPTPNLKNPVLHLLGVNSEWRDYICRLLFPFALKVYEKVGLDRERVMNNNRRGQLQGQDVVFDDDVVVEVARPDYGDENYAAYNGRHADKKKSSCRGIIRLSPDRDTFAECSWAFDWYYQRLHGYGMPMSQIPAAVLPTIKFVTEPMTAARVQPGQPADLCDRVRTVLEAVEYDERSPAAFPNGMPIEQCSRHAGDAPFHAFHACNNCMAQDLATRERHAHGATANRPGPFPNLRGCWHFYFREISTDLVQDDEFGQFEYEEEEDDEEDDDDETSEDGDEVVDDDAPEEEQESEEDRIQREMAEREASRLERNKVERGFYLTLCERGDVRSLDPYYLEQGREFP